jgi:hypothetical protein
VGDQYPVTLIAWSSAVSLVSGTFAVILATRATTPLSGNVLFIICMVIACVSFVVLLLAGVRAGWVWWRRRHHPAQDEPLLETLEPASPPLIDPALWKTRVDESGDHKSMGFQLEHRFSERLTVTTFTRLRVTVTDPGNITTSADGPGRVYQYPAGFPDAPPVRSGTYRFKWEGRDDKGAWHEIIRGTHEVKLPNLIVTIMEDSRFEDWQYIALIAALHVQVENTTDTDILVKGYGFTYDNEGRPLWDHQASDDDRRSVEGEIHRRLERQEYGQPLINYMRIPARTRISGWYVTDVTRNPSGGTPECTVIVRDDTGNQYRAVLPKREPRIYGS